MRKVIEIIRFGFVRNEDKYVIYRFNHFWKLVYLNAKQRFGDQNPNLHIFVTTYTNKGYFEVGFLHEKKKYSSYIKKRFIDKTTEWDFDFEIGLSELEKYKSDFTLLSVSLLIEMLRDMP